MIFGIFKKGLPARIVLPVLMLVCLHAVGQVSEKLAMSVPAAYRPADRLHMTTREKRNIIFYATRYISIEDTTAVRELDALAASLEKEDYPKADKRAQASILISIAEYYWTFRYLGSRKGEWVPYDERVLKLVAGDTSLSRFASDAHVHIAGYYTNDEKYEQSIAHCIAALDLAKISRDSGTIRSAYSSFVPNYEYVGLYRQAMDFNSQWLKYVTAAEKRNGLAEIFQIDNYGDVVDMFLAQYREGKNPAFADSAWFYIHKIPVTGKHAAMSNELFHFCMGQYYYETGNYERAIAHLDTSLSTENAYREMHDEKEAMKGMCLLKIGKNAAGRKLLTGNLAINQDFGLARSVYQALYENAKKNGESNEALDFYEKYVGYSDSVAELAQRGKLFEVSQKYNIRQKQGELNKLALVNVAQKKQGAAILYGSIAVILLLLSAIALLYALAKRRQLSGLKMQQALQEEKRNMELFLQRQDDRIRTEKDMAVLDQRRRISRDLHDGLSSTLAALKYYINDIRLHRNNPSEQKMLMDIENEVSTIYAQVRDYMQKLYHGTEEHEVDLNLFLNGLAEQFANDTGAFRIRIQTDEQQIAERLDMHRQTQLYFIIKEGITNAIKYAGAATITISIWFHETLCTFSISDNGKGMRGKVTKGVGLNSIADRIQALNGRFRIHSAEKGTSLEGAFPI